MYTSSSSPHVHEPNPTPPDHDPSFELQTTSGAIYRYTPADLALMPQQSVEECFIVSTGHGVSGPFTFSGVTLSDFLRTALGGRFEWTFADVESADGFGTSVVRDEVGGARARPILLATHIDGAPLSRKQGLIRLIVPSETTDALRQVKWLRRIVAHQ